MTENAGPENGGSRLIRGWQILGGKMLHWKTKDQTSLLEKARPESQGTKLYSMENEGKR